MVRPGTALCAPPGGAALAAPRRESHARVRRATRLPRSARSRASIQAERAPSAPLAGRALEALRSPLHAAVILGTVVSTVLRPRAAEVRAVAFRAALATAAPGTPHNKCLAHAMQGFPPPCKLVACVSHSRAHVCPAMRVQRASAAAHSPLMSCHAGMCWVSRGRHATLHAGATRRALASTRRPVRSLQCSGWEPRRALRGASNTTRRSSHAGAQTPRT